MDYMTAKEWLVKIVDHIDERYCQAESRQHCINQVANLFQLTRAGETSLCVSNDPATLRTAFTTTLGLSLAHQPCKPVLVVLLADCLLDMGMRLLAMQSEPTYGNYTTGELPDAVWPSITKAVGFLNDRRIYVIPQNDLDLYGVLDDINQVTELHAIDTIMVYAEKHSDDDALAPAPYQLLAALNNLYEQNSTIAQLFFLDSTPNMVKGYPRQPAGADRAVSPLIELWQKDSGELSCQIHP